jgi:hypothetical protein
LSLLSEARAEQAEAIDLFQTMLRSIERMRIPNDLSVGADTRMLATAWRQAFDSVEYCAVPEHHLQNRIVDGYLQIVEAARFEPSCDLVQPQLTITVEVRNVNHRQFEDRRKTRAKTVPISASSGLRNRNHFIIEALMQVRERRRTEWL